MKRLSSLWLFLCLGESLSSFASCKTTSTDKSVERPLLIAAFNIQNLGQSKMSNTTVMDIVKKILLKYDLVLVQEIVTTDATMMDGLMKDLNKLSPKDVKYMMVISERLGRGSAKEQYAYIYRSDKLVHLKSMTYPDPDDEFMRPPYIAQFATPTLRDMQSMIAIGIHTQPKNAGNETSSLATVYDYAVKTFKVKDAIIMGDMNAGCANVRISDWDTIELWRRTEFIWLINHDIDTTLSTNCCPYDRFVIAGDNMEEAVIWDSINAYKYRDEFGLSTEMALAVSDHWPIEVKLRGGTSKEAENNVKPNLCLTMTDQRKTAFPVQIEKQKTTYGFQINAAEHFVNLYSEATVKTEVLQNLQKLRSRYPELVYQEVVDTVLYKEAHGALDDRTSHNDLQSPLFSVNLYYDREDKTTTVNYCVTTTIN